MKSITGDNLSIYRESGIFLTAEPIIVYKKIMCTPVMICGWELKNIVAIARLIIPIGSVVVCPETYDPRFGWQLSLKMRTNRAQVDAIYGLDGGDLSMYKCTSIYDPNFNYTVGKIIEADLNTNYRSVCESGIHFYLEYRSAINHRLQ